jgi:anaerobic magnesium-protoporphyrin IX monomethyl ester cyclase
MDITLIFPPQWTPTQPYLGTACLAAYLKQKGIKCKQIDLNALFYNYILQKSVIEENAHILKEQFTALENNFQEFDSEKYKEIAPLSALADFTVDNIEDSIQWIKTKTFENKKEYTFCLTVIYNALQIFSAVHGCTFSLSELSCNVNVKKSSDILKKLSEDTIFTKIYENFMNMLTAGDPHIYGISITGISQIYPALLLAHILKDHGQVIIGGSIPTRITDSISAVSNILDICDGFIVKEGEVGLERFCTGYPKEDIPGLVYKEKDKIIYNNTEYVRNLDELPTPNFEGLDMGLYFSPAPILPVYATRACYWGKCAFCDHGYGYHKGYRKRSPHTVVKDLLNLSQTQNTHYFTFSDESIHPHHLYEIATEIIKSGLQVRWITNIRGEGRLTQDMCDTIYKAGCRGFLFGFESGSQKVLNTMRKGIHTRGLKQDMEYASRAGIWNHGFYFFGFPGETPQDAVKTMNFVKENKDILHSVGGAVFTLGKHSHIFNEIAFFPIKNIFREPHEDMAIWFDYTVERGITNTQAKNISRNFEKRLRDIYSYQWFSEKVGREHLLLFLDILGKNKILQIQNTKSNIPGNSFILSENAIITKFKYNFMGSELEKKDTYVVFDILNEKMLEISETAYFILGLCDGSHDVEDIAGALAEEYDQPFDEVLDHTVTFIEQMCDRGIICGDELSQK